MFENPRRDRQARNFTTNVPKILDLKSSSEFPASRELPNRCFSENCRWVPPAVPLKCTVSVLISHVVYYFAVGTKTRNIKNIET